MGLGGAADLWYMSNNGTQDKPAINTHTQGRATVNTILPSPINAFYFNPDLPVSCVGGPQQKPLRWRVAGWICYNVKGRTNTFTRTVFKSHVSIIFQIKRNSLKVLWVNQSEQKYIVAQEKKHASVNNWMFWLRKHSSIICVVNKSKHHHLFHSTHPSWTMGNVQCQEGSGRRETCSLSTPTATDKRWLGMFYILPHLLPAFYHKTLLFI